MSRRSKVALFGVIAVLAIGGAATAVILKVNHDNDVAAKHKAEQQARAAAAAEKRRQQAIKAAQDKLQLTIRESSVRQLQSAITKDAEKTVSQGILTGPILKTECDPEGGQVSLTADAQNFSCMAVNKINSDGSAEGYRYTAVMNFGSGSFTWHLGGP